MLILTERSLLKCAHLGMAQVRQTSQSFVHIDGARVAIGQDPSGRPFDVVPCPMTSPKPCTRRTMCAKNWGNQNKQPSYGRGSLPSAVTRRGPKSREREFHAR